MDAGRKQASVSEAVFSQLSDGERRRACVERKMNVARKLHRPDINRPPMGMIDRDRKHGYCGECRRCCQIERRANSAEVVAARPVVVVSRIIWLTLRRRCYRSGRNLKIFRVDMSKREVKLDRQGK